mmetsp:Transcript_34391/g.77736  ORF Transcript_34391/g.77736 Transcript_34391/m.77736 type:complete len:250 (+) Transcript_34391:47-796(+)
MLPRWCKPWQSGNWRVRSAAANAKVCPHNLALVHQRHVLLVLTAVVQHCDGTVAMDGAHGAADPPLVHVGEDLNALTRLVVACGILLVFSMLGEEVDDVRYPEVVSIRVGRVVPKAQHPHQAHGFVRRRANLFQLAILRVQSPAQEVEECTVTEGVAILPQEVVRSFSEVSPQCLHHLVTRSLAYAHVHDLVRASRKMQVALEVPGADYSPAAEGKLHGVDNDGGVERLWHLRDKGADGCGRQLNLVLP